MNAKGSWATPFLKQCFVTSGVSLCMCSHGLVAGFSAILLPQLRKPDSSIQVDESSESWIASVFGITFVLGNLINPIIMDKYGRKKTNLGAILLVALGFYMQVWAPDVPWLIVSRLVQGLSLGFSVHLCPIMIAEYTSPKNRGAFLSTVSLAISCGVLIIHTLGSVLHWRTAALVCALIMTVDLIIVVFSPETPSWLLKKGRYDECMTIFRWLRGFEEEEELKSMIEANMKGRVKGDDSETILSKIKKKLDYFKHTMVKKEFYKPIFIVIHLYALGQWGGSNNLSQYTPDIFSYVIGDAINPTTMTVVLTSHRVVSGIYMTYIMKRFKRRTLIIILSSITVIAYLCIAGFAYVRERNLLYLPPVLGVVLIHIHMVSICSGGVSLGFMIAGELFPLEYKSLAGGLSATFLSGNLFICAKTAPYLFTNLGIHLSYCIYAAITLYCLVIITIFLPETKDRTLQEIEDGFRNRRSSAAADADAETIKPLTSKPEK